MFGNVEMAVLRTVSVFFLQAGIYDILGTQDAIPNSEALLHGQGCRPHKKALFRSNTSEDYVGTTASANRHSYASAAAWEVPSQG